MIIGIIGSGGREHAMCSNLIKSKKVEQIFCFPGNAGTEHIACSLPPLPIIPIIIYVNI